jgi:hypothetical protein
MMPKIDNQKIMRWGDQINQLKDALDSMEREISLAKRQNCHAAASLIRQRMLVVQADLYRITILARLYFKMGVKP